MSHRRNCWFQKLFRILTSLYKYLNLCQILSVILVFKVLNHQWFLLETNNKHWQIHHFCNRNRNFHFWHKGHLSINFNLYFIFEHMQSKCKVRCWSFYPIEILKKGNEPSDSSNLRSGFFNKVGCQQISPLGNTGNKDITIKYQIFLVKWSFKVPSVSSKNCTVILTVH